MTRVRVMRVGPRARVAILLASVAGLAMFVWPLLFSPEPGAGHHTDAPYVFVGILPVLLAVVLAEISDGGIDAKALALLGVLAALGAALRPMGAGTAGIELVFFLLVLGGRVYGPGFGFLLGAVTLFASSILTGGIGPWLPFQMLGSAWVGMGAGLLPRVRGKAEIGMLAAYGGLSALVYGLLMNLWFWPFAIGGDTDLSFVAGASVGENLHRFVLFTLASSTLGWDLGRAITNVVAIVLIGPAALGVLRRAARRAAFEVPIEFVPSRDEVGLDLVRSAERDDATVTDDRDAVAPLRGDEPVGDDEHGAARERAFERSRDAGLTLGVEDAGGLVEHHHGGVGKNNP